MSDLYYTTDSLDLLPLRRAIPSPESRSTRAEIGPTHDDWSEQRRWRWGYLGDSTGRQLPFPRTSNPSTESQGSRTPPSIHLARELEMGRVSISDLGLHDHGPRFNDDSFDQQSSLASHPLLLPPRGNTSSPAVDRPDVPQTVEGSGSSRLQTDIRLGPLAPISSSSARQNLLQRRRDGNRVDNNPFSYYLLPYLVSLSLPCLLSPHFTFFTTFDRALPRLLGGSRLL